MDLSADKCTSYVIRERERERENVCVCARACACEEGGSKAVLAELIRIM